MKKLKIMGLMLCLLTPNLTSCADSEWKPDPDSDLDKAAQLVIDVLNDYSSRSLEQYEGTVFKSQITGGSKHDIEVNEWKCGEKTIIGEHSPALLPYSLSEIGNTKTERVGRYYNVEIVTAVSDCLSALYDVQFFDYGGSQNFSIFQHTSDFVFYNFNHDIDYLSIKEGKEWPDTPYKFKNDVFSGGHFGLFKDPDANEEDSFPYKFAWKQVMQVKGGKDSEVARLGFDSDFFTASFKNLYHYYKQLQAGA